MRFLISLILAVFMPLLQAAEIQAVNELSLEQAIIRVLEENPELKAVDFQARAAAERIRTARLTTPYNVSLDVENVGGNGNRDGSDAIETTLSLQHVFELGNKPGLRGGVAEENALMMRNEQDIRRVDLVAQSAAAFLEVVKQQELASMTNNAQQLAKRILETAERRVLAGRAPKAEQRRAHIAYARSEIVAANATRQVNSSRVKLSVLWGLTTPDFDVAKGELYSVNPVTAFSAYEALLSDSPELVIFATAKRLAEARLQLANAQARPNVELLAGVRHFQESEDVGLVFSANLPLATRRRASARIEEARLMQESEPYRYEQKRLALTATLYEFHQQLQHAYNSVINLRDKIVPQAKQALTEYGKGYAAGRYSFIELTEAQQDLLDARYELVNAAADYHRYQIEIDRLTGIKRSTGVQQ